MEKVATLPEEQKIPKYLVYEEMDGKPIYYKGYQEALEHEKTLDDIMGCSDLQAVLVSTVLEYLYTSLDKRKFKVVTNEAGLHLGKGNNLSSDIAIYDKAILQKTPLKNKYFDTPPLAVVEVDTNAELKGFEQPMSYYFRKTQKLLDFGVQEVVWISTESGKVMIARQQQDWITMDWQKSVTLLEQYTFSITALLKAEGVTLPEDQTER